MNSNQPLKPERLMQMAWGYAPPLIIEAAVQNKVFDLLEASPKTIPELAAASGASERGLTAILNALVGIQLLTRDGQRYSLTPESAAFLVSNKPGSLARFFSHVSTMLIPSWLHLTETAKTGKPAVAVNDKTKGAAFFADFVESLFPLSYPAARMLGEHLGVNKAASPVSVLDLAAGSGVWGIALAQLSPKVTVTAVDWPDVLEITKKVAKQQGVGDRLKTSPGDLLAADFGKGHQVATLGHILHSEGRERSRKLLRKTFEALAPGGTIAIMEFLPNEERTGPPDALIFAVNMLTMTETGDTYPFGEISGWLKEAGFVNPRLLEVPAVSPLVLATRP